jgi:hypothetical protein
MTTPVIIGNICIGNSDLFVDVGSTLVGDLIYQYPRTNKCEKCDNDNANKFLYVGSSGRICLICLENKVREPDYKVHAIGKCMICLDSDKEIMQWKRADNQMKMCFDCLFDAAIFIKASNNFEDHKSLLNS